MRGEEWGGGGGRSGGGGGGVTHCKHGPLSKRRGSEKKAYLCEMKAWLSSIVDICTSMCAYNTCVILVN